ncbi:MAG: low-specificity L-threonine aldolase [Ardenticatenaceae bacterium]|nr:low-specificity L-threonine aldolase [Ardenticatenaceae bacterium]
MTQIDLRSDTVTFPTPAMRQAMAKAEVGDDVYGEDPTANRLEALAAEMLGKEAALFVPSGTMGNLVCLLTHCGRGDEVIMGDRAHTYLFEAGGSAAVGGIHPRVLPNQSEGTLDLEQVRDAIRSENVHHPRTKLLALENTHNRAGGTVLPLDYIASARAICDEHGIALHCDGARLWNAAVFLGESPAAVAAPFDSLSVCLSKGLSAPVGSLVVGSAVFVREARRARKQLGGGMRQAGVLAAAGIVALQEMIERLADDHANAAAFAAGIERLGYRVTHVVQTNIVIFEQPAGGLSPAECSARWQEQGVLISPIGRRQFRAVTHYGIEAGDIDRALEIIGST